MTVPTTAPMKELRQIVILAPLGTVVTWSATLTAEGRTEMVNQALSTLLLGLLPLLAAMLTWQENYQGADADVRYGQDRRSFAAKTLLRSLIALTLAALFSSLIALSILRGPSDPVYVKDMLMTAPIAIAGALGLGCLFAASRAWLGRAGVALALGLNWLLGPLDFMAAVLVPVGHVRHLLGIGEQLPLPAWGSFGVLYVMAAALAALLFVRIPR